MKDFRYKNNVLEFWAVKGQVLGQNKYSETHIQSSGGGGYVDQYGGRINPVQIHSTAVTQHEFWLQREDGREEAVHLSGIDVPLREGQNITLIAVARQGQGNGRYAVLVNHNANRHWFINDGAALNRAFRLKVTTGLSSGLAWISFFIFLFIGENFNLFFLAATIFFTVMHILNSIEAKKVSTRLQKRLEALAQDAYTKPPN